MTFKHHKGYRILVHRSIPEEDLPEIYKFLKDWIKNTNEHGYGRRLVSSAYYRRGVLGLTFIKNKYTFRRLVKNRRIFGVLPLTMLEHKDPTQTIKLKQCMCAEHLGGTPVNIIGGFKEEDYDIFYETGYIKG